MLKDQLNVRVDPKECERTNFIQNGFFYVLLYQTFAKKMSKDGFDKMPVIYCVCPDERNINNFWGINFHYFDKATQEYIIDGFVKYYNIFESDATRRILSGKQLSDIYTNINLGLRSYSRKSILDSYRIKNTFLPKYLGLPAKWKITDSNKQDTKFDVAPGNKGF